jgi:hypothetical protein
MSMVAPQIFLAVPVSVLAVPVSVLACPSNETGYLIILF